MKCHPAPKTDMFIGRYQHTVDPKGRLSIPARYRNALAQYEGNLIVVPNGQSLEVYPFPEWERLVAAINDQSRFDAEVRTLGRLYVSRAKEGELDGAGRGPPPPGRGGGGGRGEGGAVVRRGAGFLGDGGPRALGGGGARARRRDRVGLRA